MLDEQQASEIVEECIKQVSHVPEVDFTNSLDVAEISDSTRVNNLITLIVHSPSIGVPSQNHRISSGWFKGIDPNTIVDEIVEIVMKHATPVHDDVLENFASLIAKHLADQVSVSKKTRK